MKKSVNKGKVIRNNAFRYNAVNDMERENYFTIFNLDLLNRIRSIKNQKVDICRVSTIK